MLNSNRLGTLCLLLSLLHCTSLATFAQDSLSKKVEFDLSLLNRYQMILGNRDQSSFFGEARVHPVLLRHRNLTRDTTFYRPGDITDSPVFHNNLQATLHSKWRVGKEVNLYADLMVEQQGHSFGLFNADRTFVFPFVRVDAARNFHLGKQSFGLQGSLGSFRNFRLNEGLLLYGLDLQGFDLSLRWKRLRLRYVQINDMQYWIGLRMNEPIIANLGADSLQFSDKWKADLNGAFNLIPWHSGPSFSMALYRPNVRVYGEAGLNYYRDDYFTASFPDKGLADQLGLVAGLSWSRETEKFRLRLNAEYRYYGHGYVLGWKDQTVGYKGGNIGLGPLVSRNRRAFAPVHYLDRPFAQLALFSDFQFLDYRSGISFLPDISAASLVADFRYRIPWNLYLEGYVDLNLLFVEGSEPFAYPFYRLGLGWEPAPGNSISLAVTNKGFDIEQHYPTHQQFLRPAIALSATRDLPSWQVKKWR